MERYFEINEKGHNIRCKLYYQEIRSIRRIVVFCHGFGGHKDNRSAAKFAEKLLSKYKKTSVVTFNWPCHGDDVKKKLCLRDCSDYLALVVAYLKKTYETDELYCYATSFGGYLTLKFLTEAGNPFRKIVLHAPALPLYDALTGTIMGDAEREQIRRGRDAAVGFDRKVMVSPRFLEELRENDIREHDYLDYAEDILILHGTADEIIPYADSAAFSEDKLIELIPIDGADHRCRDPLKLDQVFKHIFTFFQF